MFMFLSLFKDSSVLCVRLTDAESVKLEEEGLGADERDRALLVVHIVIGGQEDLAHVRDGGVDLLHRELSVARDGDAGGCANCILYSIMLIVVRKEIIGM
jgi:hypothetical protein